MNCDLSFGISVFGVSFKHCKMALILLLFVNNVITVKTDNRKLFTEDSEDEMIEPVQFDKDYNIIIRVLIKRGNETKVLDASTDRVDLMIQAPNYEEALEAEVCRFISNLLEIRREAVSIIQKEDEGDTAKKTLQVDGKLIGGAMVLDKIIEAIDDQTFIKKIKEEEAELGHSLPLVDS